MKVTYIGDSYKAIKGKVFDFPDENKVTGFGTCLQDGDKSYFVWWCECNVEINDNETSNEIRKNIL